MRLIWDVAGLEDHDFRDPSAAPSPGRARSSTTIGTGGCENYLPGFCRNVYDRLRIDTAGSVAPCAFSTDGELELGNLAEADFADMWNGPKTRDLRRAHYTWDYPSLCASCRFNDPPRPEDAASVRVDGREALGFKQDEWQWAIEPRRRAT